MLDARSHTLAIRCKSIWLLHGRYQHQSTSLMVSLRNSVSNVKAMIRSFKEMRSKSHSWKSVKVWNSCLRKLKMTNSVFRMIRLETGNKLVKVGNHFSRTMMIILVQLLVVSWEQPTVRDHFRAVWSKWKSVYHTKSLPILHKCWVTIQLYAWSAPMDMRRSREEGSILGNSNKWMKSLNPRQMLRSKKRRRRSQQQMLKHRPRRTQCPTKMIKRRLSYTHLQTQLKTETNKVQ